MFLYKRAFTEKAQHLRRCISLQTFTRGRLVPRQPRAIKRTTRTELRGENIHYGGYIYGNIGITATALRRYNIHKGRFIHGNAAIKPTTLHHERIYIAKYIHGNIGITPTASVINKQFIGLY